MADGRLEIRLIPAGEKGRHNADVDLKPEAQRVSEIVASERIAGANTKVERIPAGYRPEIGHQTMFVNHKPALIEGKGVKFLYH